jgi:hypothetical protein
MCHAWYESHQIGTLPLYLDSKEGYNPLHDDAQAMALVKRFRITVDSSTWPSGDRARWLAMIDVDGKKTIATNLNLNRAICECVANLP